MTAHDPSRTLGEIVAGLPEAAPVFERLGLDYCCGGSRTLGAACAERGVDADTVALLLDGMAANPAGPEPDRHDLRGASIAEVCDHIVDRHHRRLRDELPAIAGRLETVVRVHGADHPELAQMAGVYADMRAELEEHMALEERTLFPACRAMEAGGAAGAVDPGVLALLEHDHDDTGEALARMRALSGGYGPERALCGTHRALLAALEALERDLHQHVHEENNILFARVRVQAAA